MNKKKLIGLIGYPLSHSFSQTYFRNKFSANSNLSNFDYLNFPIKNISEYKQTIHSFPELIGFNVTIPYKEQIISYLNDIEKSAKEIGAVNTVKITHTGKDSFKLTGFNTDTYGFKKSLIPLLEKHHNKALILGTGGASKAVAYILSKMNIDFLFVSRLTKNNNTIVYSSLNKKIIDTHKLIINTTPLGMYPNINAAPDIPYQYITNKHLLYDLIYNPEETKFLNKGKKQGAQISNGYQMLIFQAEKSWELFTS